MTLKPLWALLEKELKLEFRFKFSFVFGSILDPIVNAMWFGLIYFGFFSLGAAPLWDVTPERFIPFLILGCLGNAYFSLGFGVFSYKLLYEKFWQTIEAFLVAPVSRFHLLLGLGLVEFIRISFAMVLFLGLCYWFKPVSWPVLLIVPVILFGLLMGSLGVGLIRGTFSLTNENILPFFNILYWAWGFLSCFYYPIEILPSFLKPFVFINPVYHGLTLIRHLWFDYPIPSAWISVGWVIAYALFMPIIGVSFFNQLWKRWGIQGY